MEHDACERLLQLLQRQGAAEPAAAELMLMFYDSDVLRAQGGQAADDIAARTSELLDGRQASPRDQGVGRVSTHGLRLPWAGSSRHLACALEPR